MTLTSLGWDSFFDENFKSYREQDFIPMRIIRENRKDYIAHGEEGQFVCGISGKFRFQSRSRPEHPTIGDWVAVSVRPDEKEATIHALIPRKSTFVRKVAGETTEAQVVAANIDTVFIVCGLDLNFRLRRIERYLSMAWESGALPVILLNKADLCSDLETRRMEVESIAHGADVHAISASRKLGMEALTKYFVTGRTVAFLGSSGVGKSTIINALLGVERLKVNEVSELGSRGRHTTSFRELIFLPGGGMVIDTPGMRELQVWGDDESLKQAFEDIEELSARCHFRDCRHQDEPGCAVHEAINNGSLDPKRLESFLKLKREFTFLAARRVKKAGMVEKARGKAISQARKSIKKLKRGDWQSMPDDQS